MTARVVVAGAGISGLVAAWDLMRAGVDVQLMEPSDRAGGVLGSWEDCGYVFENGPTAIQGEARSVLGLIHELGLDDQVIEANDDHRERYLYYHGSLKPLPRDFKGFFRSRLFTAGQKLRALMEPWVRVGHPEREESVAEFFGRRVGRGVTMTWVDVIVSNVFAGNPNRLGIRGAFPELAAMEQEHGSILKAMKYRERERRRDDGSTGSARLWSLSGGMGSVTSRMAEDLGDRIQFGRRLEKITRREGGGLEIGSDGVGGPSSIKADRLILAVNAPTAGILIAPLAADAADLLFEVESSPLVVAQAGFDEEQLPGLPDGFGFLIPRCMRMRTLGWVFESQLFPGRAPEGKVALHGFLGGLIDPHAIDLEDDLIEHLMMGELALALGQAKLPVPEVFRVVRFGDRLPQYNVGHVRRMDAVRRLVEMECPEIGLAGNWVAGVTVDACVKRAREVAQEALDAIPVS